MLNKKIMVLAILFVSLLAISAVSAADNVTSDVVGVEETTVDVVKETTDEVVSLENNNQVISANESDVSTFDDLAKEISAVGEGGVLNLTKDYKYVNGLNEGIQINKAITIDGQGHTLDGNYASRIFYVNVNNVVLKNIKFINGRNLEAGGAILSCDGIVSILNCTFVNNSARYGGAICCGCNVSILNCTFFNNFAISNTVTDIGGAAIDIASYCSIINCTFINNTCYFDKYAVLKNKGVIEIYYDKYFSIINCNFDNNVTDIYSYMSGDGLICNCTFNTHENIFPLYLTSSQDIIIDSCSFSKDFNNYPDYGGIIIIKKYSSFLLNNSATVNYGEDSIFTVKLIDKNGKLLTNKSILVIISGGPIFKEFTFSINGSDGLSISDLLNDLSSGTWNITVTFEGNDNYAPCNATATITVLPPSTSLTIDDVNATVGHEVTLIANVNSTLIVNEGIVTFFDGEINIGEANVVDGVATLTYTPSTAGEHTITASFNSTNYLSSNSTAKLLVDNATVEVLVNTGTVGYNSNFVANVKGLYSTINEGNVAFYINEDYLGQVPVVDGSASLVYTPLTAGDYTVRVVFSNSAKFLDDESSTVYTVKPVDSTVTINDLNGTVGHELIMTVTVVSSNNLTINEGAVTFFDGSNQIGEANVYGGVATLTYTPSSAGEHTITAIFNSDNYGSSNDTALLTVSKADVELSIDYIADVYFTNPSNFAVNVNSNYKPVNEGKVKYYVNNELVGTVDVYEGNANFNYVTGTAGSFTLTAAYEETDNYFAKNASATFNVNKMPTTLSGESIIFDEEAYKTFTTELKDTNNNGVGDQPVKIEVIKYSGESATFNGISDANGITIYDVGRLAGGMWYVTGIYAGNNNYINSRFVDKFIVVRMNTTTEIEEIDNPKVNHNYKLKANIHDENGKLVKEGIVQFYLDGVDIGSIDLSKNQGHQDSLSEGVLGAVNPMFEFVMGADDVSDLYINYVPTKAGKHTLTAVYEGTTIYKASNSTTSFDVSSSSKKETSITASSVTTVYNGGKYLTITVKDVFGKAVSGVKVTVKFSNGKTVTSAATGKNGQVKVSTNGLAPVKTYKTTITFAGNGKYDKSTKTVNVKVNKATPKLSAPAKVYKVKAAKKYIVTLKTNQNKVMKNSWITLNINKKIYKVKTNAKGQATFKINNLNKKGTFTAVVKFAGNKYYNAKTVKPKITVK